MTRYALVMFDFDGTLVESGPAIMASMAETLRLHKQPEMDAAHLRKFVGPPPQAVLTRDLGLSREIADEITRDYRRIFVESHWKKVIPYPGAEDMLEALRSAGITLAIATARPRNSTDMLISALRLGRYFSHVAASPDSGATGEGKAGQIREVLSALRADKSASCMVGDRVFDMEAAHAVGIDGVFAAYGYGDDAEVAPFHPRYSARSMEDLRGYLQGNA